MSDSVGARAGILHLQVERYADVEIPIKFSDSDTSLGIDLTTYTLLRMQVRTSSASEDVVLELTTEADNGLELEEAEEDAEDPNGLMTIRFTAEQTSALLEPVYAYDIVAEDDEGGRARFMEGRVEMRAGVTRVEDEP